MSLIPNSLAAQEKGCPFIAAQETILAVAIKVVDIFKRNPILHDGNLADETSQ